MDETSSPAITATLLYTGTRRPSQWAEAHADVRLLHAPMLRAEPLPIREALLEAWTHGADHLVVYSRHAVASLERSGALLDRRPPLHVWCVGRKTARAMRALSDTLHPLVIATESPPDDAQTFEGLCAHLARTLQPINIDPHIISLGLLDQPRPLHQGLMCYGVDVTVSEIPAYQTAPHPDIDLRTFCADGTLDWAVITSPRGAEVFLSKLHALSSDHSLHATPLAAIGPTTAEAMHTLGLIPTYIADQPDVPALLSTLINLKDFPR